MFSRQRLDTRFFLPHLANLFQMGAHAGQMRKFSGDHYHTHPQEVVRILKDNVANVTPEMEAAAYMHDVLEDTAVTQELLEETFTDDIVRMVVGLTNQKVPGMNRSEQKRHDAICMSQQPWEVRVIKLCDRLHNLPDIIENDPSHAKVYVPETRFLLDTALRGVHDVLWCKLDAICNQYTYK